MDTAALTPAQEAAIQAFRIDYSHPDRLKRRHCSDWKEALLVAWHQGWDADRPDGGHLRQLRNTLGPEWLAEYEPPPLVAHLFNSRRQRGSVEIYLAPGADLAGVSAVPHAIHANLRTAKAHAKNAGATPHNY